MICQEGGGSGPRRARGARVVYDGGLGAEPPASSGTPDEGQEVKLKAFHLFSY